MGCLKHQANKLSPASRQRSGETATEAKVSLYANTTTRHKCRGGAGPKVGHNLILIIRDCWFYSRDRVLAGFGRVRSWTESFSLIISDNEATHYMAKRNLQIVLGFTRLYFLNACEVQKFQKNRIHDSLISETDVGKLIGFRNLLDEEITCLVSPTMSAHLILSRAK